MTATLDLKLTPALTLYVVLVICMPDATKAMVHPYYSEVHHVDRYLTRPNHNLRCLVFPSQSTAELNWACAPESYVVRRKKNEKKK